MDIDMLTLLPSMLPTIAAAGAANPFEGRIYQAIAAAVVFLVVFVVLKQKAWGKILQGLQDRENTIRKNLEDADRSAKQAQTTLAEYEQRLAGAQDEVRQLIDKARQDAQQIATRMKQQAQTEITQMRSRAETDITAAQEQALSRIYEQTASLATQVASRILQRQLQPEDQKRLVADAINQLNETQPN